jgi:formylglycine-generating enzyme required for sulfatase activity
MNEGGYGCGTDSTWQVGSKPAVASPYGALDISGNVWEWVEDDWHSNYTGAPTNGYAWINNPRASYRVLRGGSLMNSDAKYLRSSYRVDYYFYPPDHIGYSVGARCCGTP